MIDFQKIFTVLVLIVLGLCAIKIMMNFEESEWIWRKYTFFRKMPPLAHKLILFSTVGMIGLLALLKALIVASGHHQPSALDIAEYTLYATMSLGIATFNPNQSPA